MKRIKELAELTTKAIVILNNSRGRFDSIASARETYETAQKVRQILISLGSDPAVIRETIEPWVNIFLLDTMRAVSSPLTKLLNAKQLELQREIDVMAKPIDPADPEFVKNIACKDEVGKRIVAVRRTIEDISYGGNPVMSTFLSLFDGTSFIDEEVLRPIRAKALTLSPIMDVLKKNQVLDSPDILINEID